MRACFAPMIALLSALAFGCRAPQASAQLAWTKAPSGLGVIDLVAGQGPMPRPGQTCVVEVAGWIEDKGSRGTLFLDTRKRGFPATFPLGVGRVIKGWDEGILSMRKGGKRLLRVPAPLGYSPQEAGHDIPPDATLIFEIELIEIR